MIDLMIVAKKMDNGENKNCVERILERHAPNVVQLQNLFFFWLSKALPLYPFVRFDLAVLILISHQIEAFGLSCLTSDLYETVYDHFRTESKQITRSHAYP